MGATRGSRFPASIRAARKYGLAHEHWFYISQYDSGSKRVFSFLQLLLNLTEAATPDNAPVFTISN